MLMAAAIILCGVMNLNAQPTYTDIGFNDIADVFAGLKKNETVVFLLRHGERGRDYSKAGLLTENGKAQARMVASLNAPCHPWCKAFKLELHSKHRGTTK